MNYNYLFLIVICCFTIIHFIEVNSFISRLSGVIVGKRSLAYSLQNAVFMLTRFFTMALLPVLGLIVDLGVPKKEYLWMCFFSLLGAFFVSVLAVLMRGRVVSAFVHIISLVVNGRSLFLSLINLPFLIATLKPKLINLPSLSYCINSRIFWLSSIVFCVYATSIFMVFYMGLYFPEYRTSISQLSGVSNSLATVLLTFWIEPKVSLAIDSESYNSVEESKNMIFCLILGRIFGIAVIPLSIYSVFFLVSEWGRLF